MGVMGRWNRMGCHSRFWRRGGGAGQTNVNSVFVGGTGGLYGGGGGGGPGSAGAQGIIVITYTPATTVRKRYIGMGPLGRGLTSFCIALASFFKMPLTFSILGGLSNDPTSVRTSLAVRGSDVAFVTAPTYDFVQLNTDGTQTVLVTGGSLTLRTNDSGVFGQSARSTRDWDSGAVDEGVYNGTQSCDAKTVDSLQTYWAAQANVLTINDANACANTSTGILYVGSVPAETVASNLNSGRRRASPPTHRAACYSPRRKATSPPESG